LGCCFTFFALNFTLFGQLPASEGRKEVIKKMDKKKKKAEKFFKAKGTLKKVNKILDKAGKEIKETIMDGISLIKNKLPRSIIILEENTDPEDRLDGIYESVEFLPQEGKLVLIRWKCFEEVDPTGTSELTGLVSPLDEPEEYERIYLSDSDWTIYGISIISKLMEMEL
jgi:hypothetical protein